MGFVKRWDVRQICNEIGGCSAELNSPYNDGFVQWGAKKDLYEIKFFLDNILINSPKFAVEDQYLLDKEKEKLISILKNDIQ